MEKKATRWSVEIFLSDTDGLTHSEARLITGIKHPLTATGTARLSTQDRLDVPEIGYELATARALRSLADQLSGVAAEDVSALADPM